MGKPNEKYEGTTYEETRKQVYEFAAGLITLGIKKVTACVLLKGVIIGLLVSLEFFTQVP